MFTFTESIFLGLRLTFDFFGKSSRSEYWWFFLFGILLNLFLATLVMFTPFFVFVFLIVQCWLSFSFFTLKVRRVRDATGSGVLPILEYATFGVCTFMFWQFVPGLNSEVATGYMKSGISFQELLAVIKSASVVSQVASGLFIVSLILSIVNFVFLFFKSKK